MDRPHTLLQSILQISGTGHRGPGSRVGLHQGIRDLSNVYLPELLERVSALEVVKVDSNLSICLNFTVFSFVIIYND